MASKGLTLPPLSPLPLQNYTQLGQYTTLLESLAFTPNVDYRVLEIFQQFQAVLWPLDNVATPTTQFLFPTPPRSELFDTLWELAFIQKHTLMYTHRYVTCWHDSMMMQYNTVTKSCTSCAEVYYIHTVINAHHPHLYRYNTDTIYVIRVLWETNFVQTLVIWLYNIILGVYMLYFLLI